MAERDFAVEIAELSKTLSSIEAVLDLKKLREQASILEAKAGEPDLWNDPENAQKVTSELSRVQTLITRITSLRKRLDDLPVMQELGEIAG